MVKFAIRLLITASIPGVVSAQVASTDKQNVKMLSPGVYATARYSEHLEVPKGPRAKVGLRLELGSWRLSGETREITVPPQGFYIADLRNGPIVTVIGGREQRRLTGELWVVQAGESMTVRITDRRQQNVLLSIVSIRSAE